ncbi:MAG: metallophosphoesterase [Chitinophagaceae bacterium]|nr:metallophosphoesterase [Chitinophagaceae bacterium]
MKRKEFIRLAAPAFLLLANGKIVKAQNFLLTEGERKKVKLRFVVASDGHYGEPNTDYENYFATAVSRINEEHGKNAFSFCVINGDVIHNDKSFYPAAKKALDNLHMKYYVSQGNHDHVTAEEWQAIWSMPVNYDFTHDKDAFLIGTTSNEKGEYLCPDIKWFSQKLEEYKSQQNVFIFIHINPGKQTGNAVDCPELFELFAKYKNVRAVFNGHDHDQDGIKMKNNIPFVFDAHFGGSWGTSYRGFRVVEILKDNSVLTYVMNPIEKINETAIGQS